MSPTIFFCVMTSIANKNCFECLAVNHFDSNLHKLTCSIITPLCKRCEEIVYSQDSNTKHCYYIPVKQVDSQAAAFQLVSGICFVMIDKLLYL